MEQLSDKHNLPWGRENGARLQLANRWLCLYPSRMALGFALTEQVFGMAWKIHRVMEHASHIDAVSLHAKQDGLSASEADAAVRVNLWPQAPAGRLGGNERRCQAFNSSTR